MKTIPIKEFRMHLAEIADRVASGDSYMIMRRSHKAFKIVPADVETEEQWETIVDFTQGGKTAGVPASEVLAALDALEKSNPNSTGGIFTL